MNISLIVDSKDSNRAVKALHHEFFEGEISCTPKKLAAAAGSNGNGNGNGKA